MQTTRHLQRTMLLAALLFGCGGSSSNVLYYYVTVGQATLPSGMDCPSAGNSTSTYTGIQQAGFWAIYPSANNQYLLDTGAGALLVGTHSGSTYTFAATTTEVSGAGTASSVTTTTNINITATTSGPGFTGTLSAESICASASGMGCTEYSTDGKNTDCTQQAPIMASAETNVSETNPIGTSTPALVTGNGNTAAPEGTCNTSSDCSNDYATPVCFRGMCVQCSSDGDCSNDYGSMYCATTTHTCVQCTNNTDCVNLNEGFTTCTDNTCS